MILVANTRRIFVVSWMLCLGIALSSCHQRPYVEVLRGKTMGTTYNISVFTPKRKKLKSLQPNIEKLLHDINQQVSTYVPSSQISRVNKSKKNTPIAIGAHFKAPLQEALTIAQSTQGMYDPTIGPLVNLWGFGPDKTQKKPSPQDIHQALLSIGYDHIQLHQSPDTLAVSKTADATQIDLSSVAKGYAVDQVSLYLLQQGFVNYLVEIGGEMRAMGNKSQMPWFVAVEKPLEGVRSPYKGFPLTNQSLATSGNYRNFFTEGGVSYAHTINPKTGMPAVSTLLSASVLSASCMHADALSTALMVMGDQSALAYIKKHNLDALLILSDPQHGLIHKKFGIFTTKVTN